MLQRLFTPARIGTLTLPHRVIMGAMHLGLEATDDGGEALAAFYTERVRGGAGLIVTGGAAVNSAGAGGERYGILTDAGFRDRLAHIASAVHGAGGLIALQLFHAGRYAPDGPVAPSPVFSKLSGAEPRELTDDEIRDTINAFADGGRYARELGFDAVEIMGSEGYLIDQFLSAVTNKRDDGWGGDAERRARFGAEVTRAVRDAVGDDFPVIARFSGADFIDGGPSRDDVLAFASRLVDAGADALNIGIGWHESPTPTVQGVVRPGQWAPIAGAIREAVTPVPVIASNRINRPEIGERVLEAGQADFVSLARPFLADSQLVARARRGDGFNVCIACNQACIDRSLVDHGPTVSCLVNPRAGHEVSMPSLGGLEGEARRDRKTRVAVVGGGPAGLQAGCALAQAGHVVTLFEASDEVGGQFALARQVPGKDDYWSTVEYLAGEIVRQGGSIERNHSVDPENSDDAELLNGFDAVVIATGVHPRTLELPGVDLPHVIDYRDAFELDRLGDRVAIIGGGGIGVDLAHYVSDVGGRVVHLLHRSKRLGAHIGRSTRWVVMKELRENDVMRHTEVAVRRITADGVEFADSAGAPKYVEADTVVIAVGQQPDPRAATLAERLTVPHRVIGGARDASALDAVRAGIEGWQAAEALTAELQRGR